jgi:hypothetical protein
VSALPAWLAKWWRGMDTGISSQTIAVALAENATLLQVCDRLDVPADGGDVGRCVRLLDLAAANGRDWRSRIGEVARVCPKWALLAPRWAEIEAAYRVDEAVQREAEAARWRLKNGGRRVNPLPRRYPPSRCYWLVATLAGGYDPYQASMPHPFASAAR